MFVAGTQTFTDSGWKNIEDISGRDKVLVRNFIGDAEFIQPFAVKRRKYDGEVIKIGAKDWSFTVTPDHPIVYDRDGKRKFREKTAEELSTNIHIRLHRNFKYMFPDEPKKEDIRIWDGFGKKTSVISPYDWYKLVAYVLMRGFIRMSPGKPMLFIFLDEERLEEEISILRDLLDRIGVSYHVQYSEKTSPKIVVSSRNTLVRRLITRLGSTTRKKMFLPDKMIYNSSKELSKLLIETILEIAGQNKISTTNKQLIDSLVLFGTLSGYSIGYTLNVEAGTKTNRGVFHNNSYVLRISDPIKTYSPTFKEKSTYSGYIYGIDLFDGQIYVKNGTSPVWINPK